MRCGVMRTADCTLFCRRSVMVDYGRETMKFVNRRKLLTFGVWGCGIALAGCGGSDELVIARAAPALAPATPSAVWDPTPWLVFNAGIGTVKVDLAKTLPSSVKRGGVFSLDTSSRPLPSGVTLSPAGILTAINPSAGIASNIVFAYAEPAL